MRRWRNWMSIFRPSRRGPSPCAPPPVARMAARILTPDSCFRCSMWSLRMWRRPRARSGAPASPVPCAPIARPRGSMAARARPPSSCSAWSRPAAPVSSSGPIPSPDAATAWSFRRCPVWRTPSSAARRTARITFFRRPRARWFPMTARTFSPVMTSRRWPRPAPGRRRFSARRRTWNGPSRAMNCALCSRAPSLRPCAPRRRRMTKSPFSTTPTSSKAIPALSRR